MTRYIIPTLLVVGALAIFFVFIDPLYDDVKAVRKQVNQLDEALANSKQIVAVRDALLERFNAISSEDHARIKKMIPDNVDNVRLILELDKVAERYGMALKDVTLVEDVRKDEGALGPDDNAHGTIGLRATITGSYDSFLSFLRDIEESLRLVDIADLSFRAGPRDFHQFDFEIRTYWLK